MSADSWALPEASDERATFFAHALSLAALHGPGPWPGGGYPLPDKAPQTVPRPDRVSVSTITDLIQTLMVGAPSIADLQRLHDLLAGQPTWTIADELSAEIGERGLSTPRLRLMGRWLAEHGTHRDAVGAGIVLIGLSGDGRDRPLLLLLGSLDDLTRSAVVALVRSQLDLEQSVFDLARRVDGWGRIHAVERLEGTQNPEIRAWLLREGFRNRVLDEYLAYLAATTADLCDALAAVTIDDALLDGAGDILTALCAGGPGQNISDYADGPVVIDRYLTLVGVRPPTVGRVAVVLRLRRLVSSGSPALDWSDQARSRIETECARLLAHARWRAIVDDTLNVGALAAFRRAIWPARQLGIDARDRIRDRLQSHPDEAYLWASLTDDLDDVLTLAVRLLPLDDLATGPSLDSGLSARGPDHILELVVNQLDRHPGKGWPLLRVALSNRMTRNRNLAVRALAAWPADRVPDDALDALADALDIEPDPKVGDRMRRLLADLQSGRRGPAAC